jgi:hypothetical protein
MCNLGTNNHQRLGDTSNDNVNLGDPNGSDDENGDILKLSKTEIR